MKRPRNFASDNNSGICPEAWAALEEANQNHAPGYGDDRWTKQAADLIREVFETDCEVFFVFNGTAANSLSLASTCRSYHSILCHENAHVEQDECGAPEFFSNGTKVQLVPGANGRMTPQGIESAVLKRTDLHFPKTRAVTLTQATELGTLYQPAQLQAIHRVAKKHELKIHMDGARFANAVAQLKVAPKEITWKAGVDILSFGCTKNGAPVGDAVVFFNHDLAHEFEWRCKQAGQLASKMRFIAAPWVHLLREDAWLRHAAHANKMAARLARGINRIRGLKLMFPRQANGVFVELPVAVIAALHRLGWHFYTFIGEGGARLMCSWDTTPEDVDDLLADLTELMANRKKLPGPKPGQVQNH